MELESCMNSGAGVPAFSIGMPVFNFQVSIRFQVSYTLPMISGCKACWSTVCGATKWVEKKSSVARFFVGNQVVPPWPMLIAAD
jgi:hypothetical protein